MASYKKTYSEVLDELLKMSSRSIPDFTTYRNEDPLVILHKLIAAMSISSNKYVDKYLSSKFVQAFDSIDTRSRYLLLQTFDMAPNKVIPGEIDVIFEYTGNDLDQDIEIPEGTQFSVGEEDNEVMFTIIDSYYVKSYNTYVLMKLIEGEYMEEDFTIENIFNNRIELQSESVAMDYVKVEVDGELYERVDYAEYSGELGVFSIEYDMNHHYNIVFSSEVISKFSEISEIHVAYIQSTGTSDYDPLDDEIIISSEVLINEDEEDEEDVADNFTVNTIVGYTVGDTNHTEESNYDKLSSIISTFRQTITTEDYENLTNYYPGVAVSAAYDLNSTAYDLPELNIYTPFLTKIVVAPVQGYYMTDQFKDNLMSYLRSVGLSEEEDHIELIDPDYVEINIELGIGADTTNQSELLDIYSTVTAVINDYFEVGNIKFGSYITKDYISSIVAKSDDRIKYVDVLEFSGEGEIYYLGYQLNAVQLPLLSNLNIIFNYRNLSLSDNITFGESFSNIVTTYYLQGDRGDHINFIDESIMENTVSDTINFDEEMSFGYYSEFDLGINQRTRINLSDIFNRNAYTYNAITRIYSDYDRSSSTDAIDVQDDLPKIDPAALVTDRLDLFDNVYNY